jgi:NAD+ kinase
MSEEGTTLVGVVGDDSDAATALSAGGVRVVTGDVDAVLDAEPLVIAAVGERALTALARRNPTVPVLPVDAGRGVRSAPPSALPDAAERILAGDWQIDQHPLVAVEAPDGTRTIGALDAMLVTAEPAEISEYTVRSGGERVARFRADGVVVATPAGTAGYARAAGGPVAAPGMDVFVVVPVSPFATTLDHWVVPLGDLTVTVERDEAPVEALVDDRSIGTVQSGDPIRLDPAGHLEVVRLPESVSPFGRDNAKLEKL